jgi:hypothetical protein
MIGVHACASAIVMDSTERLLLLELEPIADNSTLFRFSAENDTLKPEPTEPDFRQNHNKNIRKRHGARNQHKSKDFVQWLHQTFFTRNASEHKFDGNLPYHHILDVAGGKGEVAARLVMCHGMKVTMVDPREADIVSVYNNTILPKLPKKWQERYEQRCAENPDFICDVLNERYVQLVMYFTSATVLNDVSLRSAIDDCTLMIGLHADSATECIIDVALQYNKPFVVVPCCVFPNLFPQRFIAADSSLSIPSLPPQSIPNNLQGSTDEQQSNTNNPLPTTITTTGRMPQLQELLPPKRMIPVRTYEHFCEYLYQKDSRFQRTVLPFEGRNIAIWWDGK